MTILSDKIVIKLTSSSFERAAGETKRIQLKLLREDAKGFKVVL